MTAEYVAKQAGICPHVAEQKYISVYQQMSGIEQQASNGF
jgi:hypothetical protein